MLLFQINFLQENVLEGREKSPGARVYETPILSYTPSTWWTSGPEMPFFGDFRVYIHQKPSVKNDPDSCICNGNGANLIFWKKGTFD